MPSQPTFFLDKKKAFEAITPNTSFVHHIFTQKFLTVSLDEAHSTQNQTCTILPLMRSAIIEVALTATPLHTRVTDLYNIGAMLGNPPLTTESAYNEFTSQLKVINKARKKVTDEDLEVESQLLFSTLDHSTASISPSPSSAQPAAILDHKASTMNLVQWISKQFSSHIICCTAQSKDWKGVNLNKLDPPLQSHVFLKLTDQEINILHRLQEAESKDGYVNYSMLSYLSVN